MSARADGRPARDDGDAGAVRRRQLLLFSVVAAVVLVAVAAWLGMGGGKAPAPRSGIEAEIAGPDAAEKVWTRRSEARLGGIETQLRQMQQEARTLRADNDGLRAKLERDAADARTVIDRQAAVIDEMKRRMQPPAQPGNAQGNDPWFRGQQATPQGGRSLPRGQPRPRRAGARRLEAAPMTSGGLSRTGSGIARLLELFEGPEAPGPWTPPAMPAALHALLPWRAFDEASELYVNAGSTGFAIELPPFAGIDAEALGALAGTLADAAPERCTIQVLHWASPRFTGEALEGWPEAVADNGRAARLGLGNAPVPALVLFDTVTKRVLPVGFGVMAEDQMADRIFALTALEPGHDY